MNEHLIYGIIGFFLGGILGGYLAGRTCAREYKKRIEGLQEENESLKAENRKTAEKGLAERSRALQKAEKKVNETYEEVKAGKGIPPLSTKHVEELAEEYRSDAFNAHFADRVSPDDSDDIGEEDDGESDVDVDDLVNDSEFDDPFADDETGEEAARGTKISMIDEETFKNDLNFRDCATYTYYQEEGVLVDDSTQEVETDQAGVLGEEAMEIICDTEKDFIYIDNEPDDTLYEVIVDHNMSYYRDVLGF